MTNNKILKSTLKEYGYDLNDIIFPSEGLKMAICEAMDIARYDQAEIIIKNIKKKTEQGGFFDADSEKAKKIIRKLK
jgi:hypothetical protein